MGRQARFRIGAGLCGVVLALSAAPPTGAETLRLRAAGIELDRLPPLTFEVMTRELEALLAETGVSLVWRRAPPASETAQHELRVVFLDSPGRGAHADRGILAATGPDLPSPTVWVYTPSVVATLGRGAGSPLGSFLTQRAFGVALGRVLAHELVHLLVPEVPHGTGLMAPCLHPGALDGSPPVFDTPVATAFTAAARSWLRRGGPPPEAERRARALRAAAATNQPPPR